MDRKDNLLPGEYATILDIDVPDDYETYHNMIYFVLTNDYKIYEYSVISGYYPSDEIIGFKNYVESIVPPDVFSSLEPILTSAIYSCYNGNIKDAERYMKDFKKEVSKSSLAQEVKDDLIPRTGNYRFFKKW